MYSHTASVECTVLNPTQVGTSLGLGFPLGMPGIGGGRAGGGGIVGIGIT